MQTLSLPCSEVPSKPWTLVWRHGRLLRATVPTQGQGESSYQDISHRYDFPHGSDATADVIC